MKIRSVVTLIGLAISLASPPFAQKAETPGSKSRDRLFALIKIHTDALDKNDAGAIAANFTENVVLVTQDGSLFGRDAIEKHFADDFKQEIHLSNNTAPPDQDSPHIIGATGKEMWATGSWSKARTGVL
jgi:hypothetical protein